MSNEKLKAELQNVISTSNESIKQLNLEKTKYQSLKTKINNDVIPKLKTAKNSLSDAKTNLKKCYSSQEVNKKLTALQNDMDKINQLINLFNQTIIPMINSKISSINKEISSDTVAKTKATEMLNNGSL